MAVGVKPGKWIKLAPEKHPQSPKVLEKGNSNWSLLKAVVTSGIAFKLVAKQASQATQEEQIKRREKVQMEVENFKHFLLNITRAWEDLLQDLGEDEPVSRVPSAKDSDGDGEPPAHRRSSFHVKAIATGICHLFPGMPMDDHVLDIAVFSEHCPAPFKEDASGMEIDKISSVQTPAAPPKGRKIKTTHPIATVHLRSPKMSSLVTLKLWPTGKTQTVGCKDREMLEAANLCVASAILHVFRLGFIDVFKPNRQQQALPVLRQLEVVSAPLVGSWDLHLAHQGIKMHMSNLCEFLKREEYQDRVYKVTHVPNKGNSARFNNLSLYIRKECLKKWPHTTSDTDQTSVYVNVYEAGKCCVLAAPSQEVAEELADIVSDMLTQAIQQEDIRLATSAEDGGRRRKKRTRDAIESSEAVDDATPSAASATASASAAAEAPTVASASGGVGR